MTGYARLWGAAPAGWSEAGAAWRGLTAPVTGRRAALRIGATTLRAGWSGGAAAAADGRLDTLRGELTGVLPALVEADQVLAEFAVRLRAAKGRLADAVALAERSGVLIDRDGGVRPGPLPAVQPPVWRGPEAGAVPGAGVGPVGVGPVGVGPVGVGPVGVGPVGVGGQAAVAQVAAALRDALALADAADREAAARLDELSGAARAGWTAPPPPGR
ncbi:hypothetical protein V6U81_28900, partial [Micromonospora sp. CPCC 205711]